VEDSALSHCLLGCWDMNVRSQGPVVKKIISWKETRQQTEVQQGLPGLKTEAIRIFPRRGD
jgi:hypothetical protein